MEQVVAAAGPARRRAAGPRPARRPRRRRPRGAAPTTGLGASASSWSYSATIWRQSVASAVGASLCTALIAAWIWYGPGRSRRRHRRTSACPSAISARSHSARSWSASSTRSPSGVVRAARRDSMSSISASSPTTSGSSGISSTSSRPSRIASAQSSSRTSRSPVARRVPLVEDQVDDGEHRAQPVRQLGLVRHAVRDAGRRGSCPSPARAAAPSSARAPGTRGRSRRS